MRNGPVVSALLAHRRRLSTAGRIPLGHPTYMVWGSNTSLGKTLVSTGIAASFLLSGPPSPRNRKLLYLKPVQTGFPSDSDSRYLFSKLLSLPSASPRPLFASHSVLRASLLAAGRVGSGICELGFLEEASRDVDGGGGFAVELRCETLYAWKEPVSPHLAAELEGATVEDSAVMEMLGSRLRNGLEGFDGEALCVVETAGGVASPAPSGTLQCDLYRQFRLPGILVGDGRLGGISSTISAYETLKLRGYDIAAVVFEDHGLVNEVPLLRYLRNSVRVPVIVLPPIPQDLSNDLADWYNDSKEAFHSVTEAMLASYWERLHRLKGMQKKAGDVFWWPFTQHKFVPEETVTVIDSRFGENFAVCQFKNDASIMEQFDACASWWTQGPDNTLQIELARDMGYAAARYGHVMFPENVYEPALKCAELLLEGVGKGK